MKVKFDKDMLLKHRFWLLLALSLPLIIVALFILITKVSADTEAARKKAEDMAKKLQGLSNPSGPKRVEDLNAEAVKRKEYETIVHGDAFNAQKYLFTWPQAIEDKFDFQNGFFATEIKIVPSLPETPGDDETFHGKIKENDEDSITLVGKDKDGKDKEAKFYRTAKIKVARPDKKEGQGEPQFGTISIEGGDQFASVTYYRAKYFYDEFTDSEQRLFVNEYKSQLHPILQIVDPVDAEGNGTVQFNGWPYVKPRDARKPLEHELPQPRSKFFTFVAGDWIDDGFIYDEAWLAQEDLWVQRELFRIIREANDSVARFEFKQPKKTDKDPPVYVNPNGNDKSKPAVFTNAYVELKFDWEGPRLFVTVKNQLSRRQKLDVHFRVRFNEAANRLVSTEKVLLGDEPLEPFGDKGDTKRVEITLDQGGIKRTGVYEVEQVLTWETAPVKRIDVTAIGGVGAGGGGGGGGFGGMLPGGGGGGAFGSEIAHSHRTFTQGSKPYREEKKDALAADPMAAGPMGGLPGGAVPGGEGGRGGFGGFGQAALVNVGVNGVLKDRYLEISDQSRRIPVGMALIVDQDHIDRVLTAFNNSKLRFLTTQVLLNRYPLSVRPQLLGAAGGPAMPGGGMEAAPPSVPMGYTGRGGSGGRGEGGGPGNLSGPGPGANASGMFGPGSPTGGVEDVENNVEMVIYGVVTLYERYPKRKVLATDAPKDAK